VVIAETTFHHYLAASSKEKGACMTITEKLALAEDAALVPTVGS
jgi:hypothetical protein